MVMLPQQQHLRTSSSLSELDRLRAERHYRESFESSLSRLNEARYLADRISAASSTDNAGAAAAAAAGHSASFHASMDYSLQGRDRGTPSRSVEASSEAASTSAAASASVSASPSAVSSPRAVAEVINEIPCTRSRSDDSELGRSSLAQRVINQMASSSNEGVNFCTRSALFPPACQTYAYAYE